jgi:hypothetical protein
MNEVVLRGRELKVAADDFGRLAPMLRAPASVKLTVELLGNATLIRDASVSVPAELSARLAARRVVPEEPSVADVLLKNPETRRARSVKAAVSVGVWLPVWVSCASVLIVMVAAELLKNEVVI